MVEQLLNIQFVSEVEKYPCLYNYKIKEYTKKDVTEKAWIAVGKAVNLTALQAKEKWKNLRSVFVRNLKPPPSGSSKRKKYYLTDAMLFALPYIKTAGIPSGNLPTPETQDDEENEPQETNQNISPLPSISPPPPSYTISPTHQTERSSTPLTVSTRRSSSVSSNQHFKRSKNKMSDTDELFTEYLKSKMIKQKDDEVSTNNTANKMFLLSLLPDLNSMTPIQVRLFKRQVIDLIDNILNVSPSSQQTPTLIHIPNTPSTSSSQTSTYTIQYPNTSSSQTTRIELPNTIQYKTDDRLNEDTYIQLLQDTIDEANDSQK